MIRKPRLFLISFLFLISVFASNVLALSETDVLFALETSDKARVDGIDYIQDYLEGNPGQNPWSYAALGRVDVIKGLCGDFMMLKLYQQNKGFGRLEQVAEENPGDFYALMWLGASAVESNYVFVSAKSARDYLMDAIEILMESDAERRVYFLSYCYYFLGLLEKDSGDLKRALNYWELSVEIEPDGRMAERASNLIGIFTG